MIRRVAIGAALSALLCAPALARGVSPYLPLNLSPDLDRKIQRVLLLGDKPVMRKPVPAAVVLDALPTACARDRALCEEVRAYLKRFMRKAAVAHARVSAATSDDEARAVLPNAHGLDLDESWEVRAQAYYQPSDYLLIAAGGIARDEEAIPTDSMISFGFEYAQLDVGYRDHWLSPLSDSSSLIGTQAPTMLSATVSNYTPISRLGLSYELFAAEMSHQENIVFESGVTSGKPRLAGIQLSMEPADGYALALNRITQYGGGARGGDGVSGFVDAVFTTSNRHDASGVFEEVNRVASATSSMLFQGATPFALHIEYAGEDNTYRGRHRLGWTNLSLGLDFPALWDVFEASYEVSDFQNVWYVHRVYTGAGLTHRGHVLGHWFGDNRLFADEIGGTSHMLRLGWRLRRGDYAEAKYRALALDSDWPTARPAGEGLYRTMQLLELNYSTLWRGRAIDAQLHAGRDVFGDSFVRLGAAFDFAQARPRGRSIYATPREENSNTELFVDVGVQYSRAREYLLLQFRQRDTSQYEPHYHVGVGARRRVSERSDLGVRLELDEVQGYSLLSLRALDYRYRLNRKLALGAFVGAGRYDINLAAHGWYLGAGVQYRDALPGWDVGLDYRFYDKLTRDKGLPSDPESNPGLPRRVIDIDGLSLYVSKRW